MTVYNDSVADVICGREGCVRPVERRGGCGPWPTYCGGWCQRAAASARRRAARDQVAKPSRECGYCSGALPQDAPSYRRFCSALCGERFRHGTARPTPDRSCPLCGERLRPDAPLQKMWCSRSCKDRARGAQEHERLRRLAYGAQYRNAHREAATAYAAAYRAAHRGALREMNRAAYKDDPLPWKQGNYRRRAREAAAEKKLVTARDWRRLVDRYRGCCAYCGSSDHYLTVDHVVPLTRGGRHAIGNLLPACPRCNKSKNKKLLTEWRLWLRRFGREDSGAVAAGGAA